MNQPVLYPLLFVPQLKEKVWGGTKLVTEFHKMGEGKIGESWELSGVEGAISVVANGPLQGAYLTDLINEYKEQLVGKSVYHSFGNEFPLLFKFIDAAQDLSVQLHPDDTLAKERHNAFGKTEMWYVLHTDANARLILGFNRLLDKASLADILKDNTITSVLNEVSVKQGDAFFIAPGTVHAIGAGVVLAEIQQTSDITYRIYDWDRPDTDGTLRKLHIDEAMDAIDFTDKEVRILYQDSMNCRVLLRECPYFVTHKLVLDQNFEVTDYQTESCKVYMCTSGSAHFRVENDAVAIQKGQTLLMPAGCTQYSIETENATFLEVYIPQ
ncbi:MAG: type I phosphomannose isomerase catalytic subunit [Marinirhabdus sp.]|nr:type I phosphomannose isomerase catalytic subunit [Marinirhabdus sp.]